MGSLFTNLPLEDLKPGITLIGRTLLEGAAGANDFPRLCFRPKSIIRGKRAKLVFSPDNDSVYACAFDSQGENFDIIVDEEGKETKVPRVNQWNAVLSNPDYQGGREINAQWEGRDDLTGKLTLRAGHSQGTYISAVYEMVKRKSTFQFGCGSPLAENRQVNVLADAYGSTGFLNFGKGHSGMLNFGSSGNEALDQTGLSKVKTYGSVGFLDLGMKGSVALSFGSSSPSALPPSLQARGQLYPMLKRVKLKNAKQKGREVWQFSTGGRMNIYLDVKEEVLDAGQLTEDKPHTWYLLEDPQDIAADPYILGIGRKAARVHVPGSAIVLTIIDESNLFSSDNIIKPVKERAALDDGAESTSNLSGKKLRTVVEELAFKVSYKTICTMMRRVAPEGVDPTSKIRVQLEAGEVRDVRLVVYVIHKKYLRMLGTIGERNITHLVAVWTEDEELISAYWASAGETLDNALGLIHAVTVRMQKGDLERDGKREQEGGSTSVGLIEALLETESPTQRFNNVPGEYGAAVREAVVQDYVRQKKASRAGAFSNIATDVIDVLTDAARYATVVVEEGVDGLKGLFGASLDEAYYEEDSELSAPIMKEPQPYTKLTAVYDQRPYSSCVLCSIGTALSLVDGVSMSEAYLALREVIPPEKVPPSGLVIRDALRSLEPVFENYGQLQWRGISTAVDSLKKALDAGIPVIVGTKFDGQILKYESNLDTPLSGPGGLELMHCVTLVAYDDADSTFTALNSWGPAWGRNGAMIVEQDYNGFQKAFVIFRKGSSSFGAVDIAPNLTNVLFKEN